jgi:hypothetical protein
MSVYSHLKRVGLEAWAPTLAHFGFRFKADLAGLTVEEVRKWSGALRLDRAACSRMKVLLEGESKLVADYQLADMATVKDMFIATFGAVENSSMFAVQERASVGDATSSTRTRADAVVLPGRQPGRSVELLCAASAYPLCCVFFVLLNFCLSACCCQSHFTTRTVLSHDL